MQSPAPGKEVSSAVTKQRTSILHRQLLQAGILTTFIIVLFSTVSFVVAESLLERAVLTQLASVASASEDELGRTMGSARERVALLTTNTIVKQIFAGSATSEDLTRLLAVLKQDQPALTGIELSRTDGTLLARAGESVGLPPVALTASFHRAVLGLYGWQWYDTFSPATDETGQRIGVVALRYDAQFFLTSPLALVSGLGESAALTLSMRDGDVIRVLRPNVDAKRSTQVLLSVQDTGRASIPAVAAVMGDVGFGRFQNDRGADVLAAEGDLPILGWGLTVDIERRAALQQVRSLAVSHTVLGALLILLALALAYLLGEQLTAPLRQLTARVRLLRPGYWQLRRTVHTGDEVEVLDQVVTDLAVRLERVYSYQEEEISSRTAELKKQYALDRAILDGIDQGVLTVDRKGIVTGANPAALRLLEFESAQLIGKMGPDALNLRGHDGVELKGLHPIMQCLDKKRAVHSPPNARWNVMRKDETLLPVLIAVSPLLQDGSIFGAIIVIEDFTEERRLDYLKSEFITLASHQLRTPLSAVRWYVELFQEDKKNLDENQQSYLREMDTGLKRMASLLNDLLHAAHLEDDALKPDMQPVDGTQVAHELFKDAESLAKKAGLTCYLRAPNRKAMFETDPTLVRIVLQNLISNAIKYSRKGKSVTIHLDMTDKKVAFSVEDEGVGIPSKDQERVFQRFFRAKNVRQMDTDGNGLGLYITKAIVERLGGTIGFKSRENSGTIFTATFPVGNVGKKK